MAIIASEAAKHIELSGGQPVSGTIWKRPTLNLAAWLDLFFGTGPLWCRLLRWGQRNSY
jgi:hypothetical protein